MGSAFRQKLSAFTAAREQYIARNQHKNKPDWGFITKFSTDTGASTTYIGGISQIADNPEISSALENFSGVGYNTALALVNSDPDIADIAIEQLESTGELTVRDIADLSEHEIAQIDRDIEREIAERERRLSEIERVVPTDDHIDRLVTLLISGGQQLETYCLRKNTVVQPEQFATFVANRLIDLSDHCDSDPEVYTSNLESIREFIRLVGSALDRVPEQRESHLKLVK
jgi:ribosomal protein S13